MILKELFRYTSAGVGTLLAIDIDQDALDQLQTRRSNSKSGHTKIITRRMDLNQPYTITLNGIKEAGIERCNFMVCNFAIHYLISSEESLNNIFNVVDKMLISGGKFIFTCFDGKRIFDLVRKGRYKLGDKFLIEKRFEGNKFETYGLKVAVKLPFSDTLYEEYLVDIENIIKYFERKGYEVEKNYSFYTYLHKFKVNNLEMYSKMSADDKKFVSLYNYVSLWKQ
jgi:hypothetical protein